MSISVRNTVRIGIRHWLGVWVRLEYEIRLEFELGADLRLR